MQPKVSVIVPVYKVENYLTQCLDSIVNQTLKDIEIIVIDEGDKDRCREIIDYFESIDGRIVAVHEKQGGYGNSVNRGFELAHGEYISIIESDDFIEKDMLEKLYAQITRFDADIVKSPYYEYRTQDDEKIVPIIKDLIEQLPENKAFELKNYPILLSTHPSIWAGLYKTEWLKKTGIKFLTKGAYLDIKFRFETLLSAKKICWLSKPFYHWRVTNPTSTNASWNLKAALERWDYIHSCFEDRPELWASLSTYMLPEENLNLFIRYKLFGCTPEQRKKIKKYKNMYPTTVIKYCPYICAEYKNNLLGNLDVIFCKRVFKRLYRVLTSIQIRHFSYKAILFLACSAIVFNLMDNNNAIFSLMTKICDYSFVAVFLLFVLYWFVFGSTKFFKKLKKILSW